MADHKYVYEGLNNGTVWTSPSDPSPVGGEPFTDVIRSPSASTTLQVSSDKAMRGTRSLKFGGPDGATARIGWKPLGGLRKIGCGFGLNMDALPGAQHTVQQTRHASGIGSSIFINASSKVGLAPVPSAGTAWTSTKVMSPLQWYWISSFFDFGTSTTDGKLQVAIYTVSGTTYTLWEQSPLLTGYNLSGLDIADVRWGKITATGAFSGYLDVNYYQDNAVGMPGSVDETLNNLAPTTQITADKTSGVEPGDTVTLSLTENDLDGTIAQRILTQESGKPVTVNGTGALRTYEAPYTKNGDTVTFAYKAVDDDGSESAAATVSSGILRATHTVSKAGIAVPVRHRVKR